MIVVLAETRIWKRGCWFGVGVGQEFEQELQSMRLSEGARAGDQEGLRRLVHPVVREAKV